MERVRTIQGRVWDLQRIAGQTVARAHAVIGKAANVDKADQAGLDQARELVRKAQWLWDCVAAENSMGFHNPDQVLHALGRSIDLAHQSIQAADEAVGPRN